MENATPESDDDQLRVTSMDGEATVDYSNSWTKNSSSPGPISPAPSMVGGFRLVRLLGAGGMGQVYEGTDELGHRVAVKILSPKLARSEEAVLRFKKEGAIASTINHPRCVFVKSADTENGTPYIAMELMTGLTLKELVVNGQGIPYTTAVSKIMDVLEGLQEAHLHGMIHRDIKPANCYLEESGRVKVGDFGLATSLIKDSEIAHDGNFAGTPLFASPEQIRGEELDERTDIYSICATLYFLLTGQAPFEDRPLVQIVAGIVSDDPPPLRSKVPSIPIGLEQVIAKGLSRDRDARYQTVEELRRALLPFSTQRKGLVRIGQRLSAWFVDFLVTSVLAIPLGIIGSREIENNQESYLAFNLLATLILWVYYAVCEWRWGATFGKLVMRLKVVDVHTEARPSFKQIFFRSAIYILSFGGLADFLGFVVEATSESSDLLLTLELFGTSLSVVASLAVILFNSNRQMFHEIFSQTKVIDVVNQDSSFDLSKHGAEWRPLLQTADAFPSSFGSFDVQGVMWQNKEQALLLAKDASLDRSVWLLLRPVDEPSLSESRKACDRATRMRWLSSGQSENWRWDAFVAPIGSPLDHWTGPNSVFPWSFTRRALHQLLEELRAEAVDSSSCVVQAIDQIWMDRRGRLLVADVPAHLHSEGNIATDTSSSSHPHAVLQEASRQLLCGKQVTTDSRREKVPAIVPLSARRFLNSLTAADSKKPDLASLARTLDSTKYSNDRVTLGQRLVGLFLACLSMSILAGYLFVCSFLFNTIEIVNLSRNLARNQAVLWICQSSSEFDHLKKMHPEETANWNREEIQNQATARAEALHQALRQRKSIRLWFERTIQHNAFQLNDNWHLEESATSIKRVPGKKYVVEIPEWSINNREGIEISAIKEVVSSQIQATPLIPQEECRQAILLMQIPILVAMLWSGLLFGGLPMLMAHIHIVRKNGQLAPWWLRIARSSLMFFPVLLLSFAVQWTVAFYPEHGFWIRGLMRSLYLLPIVYIALACLSPTRAPHDKLLGTYLVPD